MAISFDAGRWAAQVTRISERGSLDSVDVDRVFDTARELRPFLEKWGVFERVQVKIARMIVERDLSPRKVGEIIETTIIRQRLEKHHKHYVRNPGGFFIASVKNELERKGLSWRDDE